MHAKTEQKRRTVCIRATSYSSDTSLIYEECTAKEWDRESEVTREFINFGDGYTFARLNKRKTT